MSKGATATAKIEWSTGNVMTALRERYPPNAYAFLAEVSDGTGSHRSRSADAIVMSLWPSRGLDLMGFEVKVSRSDWIKELEDPSKADAVCRYCDRWYVVAGNPGIVLAGELPPTWGLIERKGEKLVVAVDAPKLKPIPFDRSFIAAVMRRTYEQLDGYRLQTVQLAQEYSMGVEAGRKAEEALTQRRFENANSQLKQQYSDLRANVEAFEKASGISLWGWNKGREIGEAVNLLRSKRIPEIIDRLALIQSQIGAAIEGLAPIERDRETGD